MCNVAQLIVSEVFGSAPSTSAPTVQLAEVLDAVQDLITSGLFYGASGVLTSVVMYHPNLDFATIYSGYADGLSMEDIQTLGESLLPHARLVAKQVSAQWVMDVRHEDMARSVRRGGCRPACKWHGACVGSGCRHAFNQTECRPTRD